MPRPGHLINIAGPSAGVGKTAIVAELEKIQALHLVRLRTFTTRQPRQKDPHDRDQYHFVSEKQFAALKRKGYFLETKRIRHASYGSPISDLRQMIAAGNNVVTTIDSQRIKKLKRAFPNLIAIFIDAPNDLLRQRMIARGETPKSISARLQLARRERKWKGEYDKIFLNAGPNLSGVVTEIAKYLTKRLK